MPGDRLKEYRRKRDFRRTPEPGKRGKRRGKGPFFVIQEHDARQRHFDFRLQVGDALKSWAVPKGPSTDPREKRLAVQVEDHPLDYADFEGVIPEGEYGAGSVIVWDHGPYRNENRDRDGKQISLEQALRRGRIELWLDGQKLQGGYALVRTRMGGKKKNWLLIKMKDEKADARRSPVSSQPKSVLSDRTVKQVARDARRQTDGEDSGED
ncbi:MAG: DNA ligase [Candidatus Eisenbacteria bacterium]|nr:DNA ligase [Candidatus Eisenbacteria bacterium]